MSKAIARKRRMKTTRRQSGFLNFLILVALVFVCIFLAHRVTALHIKSKELAQTEVYLQKQIEAANVEHDKLVSQEAYMKTNAYIEDVAKEKLGLVYPDEIVIKPAE